MPNHSLFILTLALVFGVSACGERAQADRSRLPDAQRFGDEPADPASPKVDPCKLFSDEEVSEQLWLALSPDERASYNPKGFDITRTETPWGISRRCDFHFGSKAQVSGGPAWRSDFNVIVSPMAPPMSSSQKEPIAGVGDEAFSHQRVWYVRVGDLTASLTDFPATGEGAEEDAGRVALLKLMAQRLR